MAFQPDSAAGSHQASSHSPDAINCHRRELIWLVTGDWDSISALLAVFFHSHACMCLPGACVQPCGILWNVPLWRHCRPGSWPLAARLATVCWCQVLKLRLGARCLSRKTLHVSHWGCAVVWHVFTHTTAVQEYPKHNTRTTARGCLAKLPSTDVRYF